VTTCRQLRSIPVSPSRKGEGCKNGRTDRRPVWGGDSWKSKKHCTRRGSPSVKVQGAGYFYGVRIRVGVNAQEHLHCRNFLNNTWSLFLTDRPSRIIWLMIYIRVMIGTGRNSSSVVQRKLSFFACYRPTFSNASRSNCELYRLNSAGAESDLWRRRREFVSR